MVYADAVRRVVCLKCKLCAFGDCQRPSQSLQILRGPKGNQRRSEGQVGKAYNKQPLGATPSSASPAVCRLVYWTVGAVAGLGTGGRNQLLAAHSLRSGRDGERRWV